MMTWEKSVRMLKIALTLAFVILGVFMVRHLYVYYTYAPQTRDGKVRADVVALAADVSGPIEAVLVRDNQTVQRGQVLFVVDQVRLANRVAEAEAAVAVARAQLSAAQRENKRYRALAGVVSQQEVDHRRSEAEAAQAQYAQATASLARTQIDLARAEVRSPVNGIVTNFSLRAGAYATAGQPLVAIVDQDSFYVAGYFEETKVSRMKVGMRATIYLMGEPRAVTGHVEGLAAGVEDRERVTASGTLLANVNPTFSWVRLAQRVPVRIAIDAVPEGMALIAGRTATVVIEDETPAGAAASQHG